MFQQATIYLRLLPAEVHLKNSTKVTWAIRSDGCVKRVFQFSIVGSVWQWLLVALTMANIYRFKLINFKIKVFFIWVREAVKKNVLFFKNISKIRGGSVILKYMWNFGGNCFWPLSHFYSPIFGAPNHWKWAFSSVKNWVFGKNLVVWIPRHLLIRIRST